MLLFFPVEFMQGVMTPFAKREEIVVPFLAEPFIGPMMAMKTSIFSAPEATSVSFFYSSGEDVPVRRLYVLGVVDVHGFRVGTVV